MSLRSVAATVASVGRLHADGGPALIRVRGTGRGDERALTMTLDQLGITTLALTPADATDLAFALLRAARPTRRRGRPCP